MVGNLFAKLLRVEEFKEHVRKGNKLVLCFVCVVYSLNEDDFN